MVGDALMLAAIVACGLGYAEGARLSRELGGWQVISWALVLSLPLMLPRSCSSGLLPLATALFGVWRGPALPFWIFSIIGSGALAAFALRNGGQASWSAMR